jgi:hypothetical protein
MSTEAMKIVADEYDKRAAMARQIADKCAEPFGWSLTASVWTEAAIVLRKAILKEAGK